MRASDPSMTWGLSLEQGGRVLVVDLQIQNRTGQALWICDGLLTESGAALTDRLIVANGDHPGEVWLARGPTSGARPSVAIPPASYRALPAGEIWRERISVPWPEPWNPQGAEPLQGAPRAVSLSIAWFAGEPTVWSERPGADGSTLRLPEPTELQWFDGGTQALP